MSLLRALRRPHENWQIVSLDADAKARGVAVKPMRPDLDYVDVWLEAMQLVDARRLFTTYYPVLTSEITQQHLGSGRAKHHVVVGGHKLTGPGDANRVLIGPRQLSGPTPYRGGPLGVDIGLLRLKASDLAEPYVGLLAELATAVGITTAGPAGTAAAILGAGVKALVTQLSREGLDIGLSHQFREATTGLFAVIGAPPSKVQGQSIRYPHDRLTTGVRPLERVPYIVFSVQAAVHQYRWTQLPELAEFHARIQEARAPGGHRKHLKSYLADFDAAVRASSNLVEHDKQEIIEKQLSIGSGVAEPLSARGTKSPSLRRLTPHWSKAATKPLSA